MKYFITLLLLLPLTAFADHKEHREDFRKKMFEDLNLTAEQQSKVDALNERDGSFKDDFKKMRQLRQELDEVMLNPSATDEEIRAKAEEMHKIMESKGRERMNQVIELRKILTPEQFKKFMAKIKEHMDEKRKNFARERDE